MRKVRLEFPGDEKETCSWQFSAEWSQSKKYVNRPIKKSKIKKIAFINFAVMRRAVRQYK